MAAAPDFMLTVWDWQEERIALHSKAFGQDVFDVKFSLDDDRRLVTSGTGHIRFWKMASTFTGLKLQGHIGKFGKIELSDIQAFVELPDGKVVSGTETGSLLLWEGNFIKCRFVQVNGRPCHASEVTHVDFDRKDKCVVTASEDGFIRWWDFNAIDAAEVDSDVTMDFELLPLAEYYLGAGCGVRTLVDGGAVGPSRSLIIIDKLGRMETVTFTLPSVGSSGDAMEAILDPSKTKYCRLFEHVAALTNPELVADAGAEMPQAPQFTVGTEFHSGAITAMEASPAELLVATAGIDGTVRCWDITQKRLLVSKKFSSACTSLRWLPRCMDDTSRHILVGFADGVVRLLMLGEGDDCVPCWTRKMVFKPHTGMVIDLRFSACGTLLATAGKEGNVFVFKCSESNGPNGSYTPLRFFIVNPASLQAGKVTTCEKLDWSADSKKILCSCSDAVLREVDVAVLSDRVTQDVETYEFTFPIIEYTGKIQAVNLVALTASESKASLSGGAFTAEDAEGEGHGEHKGSDVDAVVAPSPSSPSSPSKKRPDGGSLEDVPFVPLKVSSAIYTHGLGADGSFLAAAIAGPRAFLLQCRMGEETPSGSDMPLGVYSSDGKSAVKVPVATSMAYGQSKKLLAVGTADGSVILRPAQYLSTFLRVSAHNGPVTCAALSFDDRFVISSGADGTLQVHVLLPDMLSKAVELFKDLDAGVFGGVSIKPQSSSKPQSEPPYLCSISSTDGIPVIADAPVEGIVSTEAPSVVLPHIRGGDETLELPEGAYSIQEAKLKSEEDAKLLTADALKENVRLMVKSLQRDYQRAVEQNNALPIAVRVSPQAMSVDGTYFEALREKGDAMVVEVHRENEYEAEKAFRLREKISSMLMPDLLVEEITLKALSTTGRTSSYVRSVRTQGISASVKAICDNVRARLREQELEADKQTTEAKRLSAADNAVTSLENTVQDDVAAFRSADGGSRDGTAPHGGARTHSGTGSGPAHRREMRRQRKLRLKEHSKEKPNEDDDDPRDVDAINYAEKTIGDYKLKSSEDYEVPEDMRINAEKKKQQMAMLEESLAQMRLEFNERFLSLRSLKAELVVSIKKTNRRLLEIGDELQETVLMPSGAELWEPKLDPLEFPDDRGEVSMEELEKYIEARKRGGAASAWTSCPPVPHSAMTSTKTKVYRDSARRGFITGAAELAEMKRVEPDESTIVSNIEDTAADIETSTECKKVAPGADLVVPLTNPSTHIGVEQDSIEQSSDLSDLVPKSYQVDDSALAAFRGPMIPGSNIELKGAHAAFVKRLKHAQSVVPVLDSACKSKKMTLGLIAELGYVTTAHVQESRRKALRYEKDSLMNEIQNKVSAFQEAVDSLRWQRQQLIGDLKQGEIKLLTYFQEYQLLLQFEGRDLALQQKQIKSVRESSEIKSQVSELELRLEGKREELKQCQDKSAQVLADFRGMVPDNHTFLDALTKIYKKKIHRKLNDGDNGDGEDEQEEEEEDEEEDEDDAEDVCPIGCDVAVYDKVLELRDRRLGVDEMLATVQKGIDEARKALDRLKQRGKQVEKDVQQVEVEIRQFQKQKLVALNQIEIVVPLSIGQIYAFSGSGMLTGPEPTQKLLAQGEAGAGPETTDDGAAIAALALEELKDPSARQLVPSVTMTSHVLIGLR